MIIMCVFVPVREVSENIIVSCREGCCFLFKLEGRGRHGELGVISGHMETPSVRTDRITLDLNAFITGTPLARLGAAFIKNSYYIAQI